jgi:hypothetical protein
MENKEELLPIGTKVYIRYDSEHFYQGVKDGERVIGVIEEHLDTSEHLEGYVYRVSWNNRESGNTYQNCDLEIIEKNEEEINNELKQLFNQILNN